MTIDPTFLQYVYAPALLGIGGFVAWLIKSKTEELRSAQAKLHEDRLKIYEDIIEPYFSILGSSNPHGHAKALKTITSEAYRKTTVRIALFGSDRVVKAWNTLMQHHYTAKEGDANSGFVGIGLFADLLLEIRKDLGNKNSSLGRLDMLRGIVKDIEDHKRKMDG